LARAEEASKKEETGNLILAYMRVSETSNELARAEEASPVTKKRISTGEKNSTVVVRNATASYHAVIIVDNDFLSS